MSGVLLVLGGVAVGLSLLDADAHGEGLSLHGNAPAVEQFKGVPGGVTGAEDQLAAGQWIGPLRAGDGDTVQGPVLNVQIRQLMLKPDIRTQVQQLPPQVFQGNMEIVGAHMGLGVIEDLLRRTAADQLLQNKAVPEVLSTGVELAVGKGPGAALSELNVAGEVQLSGGPEALHIGSAVLHAAAPL